MKFSNTGSVICGGQELVIDRENTEYFVACNRRNNYFSIEKFDGNIRSTALFDSWILLDNFVSPIEAYAFLKENFSKIY